FADAWRRSSWLTRARRVEAATPLTDHFHLLAPAATATTIAGADAVGILGRSLAAECQHAGHHTRRADRARRGAGGGCAEEAWATGEDPPAARAGRSAAARQAAGRTGLKTWGYLRT